MHHWLRLLFVDFLLNYIWNSEYLVKNMRKIWSIFLFDVMMKG